MGGGATLCIGVEMLALDSTLAKHLNTYVLRRMLECRFAPFVSFCTRIHLILFYFPICTTRSIKSHLSKTCAAVQILNDGVSLDSVERCPLDSPVCPLESCDWNTRALIKPHQCHFFTTLQTFPPLKNVSVQINIQYKHFLLFSLFCNKSEFKFAFSFSV